MFCRMKRPRPGREAVCRCSGPRFPSERNQSLSSWFRHAVGHPDDIGGDPISGPSGSRKPAMDDHVIVFSNDQARFVLQRRRRTPNQIEQAVAPRRDVRAVLNQDYSRTLAHSISATGQSDTDVSNAARATMKLLARARTSCPAVSSLTTLTVLRQLAQRDWSRREWTNLRRIKLEALLDGKPQQTQRPNFPLPAIPESVLI